LSNIGKIYGSINGSVIITGATNGLGPSYCKKFIECGFKDFILIDES
jgi:short-subunit dehydrogenase